MERLLVVYGAWTVAVQGVASMDIRAIHQIVTALASMRLAVLFAVFAYGWRQPRWRPVVLGVLMFEVGIGFLAFFSNFKEPLFVFAAAVATTGYRPRLRAWVGLFFVFLVTLYLGVLCSAIKMDYRDRLSGGEGARTQVIRIGVEERAESFLELVGTVDAEVLENGFDALMRRVAYVEFFSYVIDYVPAVRDHERGMLWGNALSHVLMPRVFFPDKPWLPLDTLTTERYTGLSLGGGNGTSISIGMAAESYVDFGRAGVFVVALLFGAFVGLGYRSLIVRRHWGVIAQGIVVSICLQFYTVDMVAAKALGGFLSLLIISVVGWGFLMPRLIPWLRAGA